MKKISVVLLAVTIAVTTLSCGGNKSMNPRELSEEDARIESVMKKAVFEDTDGNEVTIQDYAGKVVLIDYWETWCSPCLQVFPAMDSLRAEYGNDFEVLTVNLQQSDNRDDVIAFKEEMGYDFTYLLDVNEVAADIITLGIPFKIFFDPDGFLIKTELGSAGTEGDYLKAKTIIDDNKAIKQTTE